MTVEEIRKAVEEIAAEARDFEVAHGDEDSLHVSVLEAIAAGAPNAQELAREALKTLDLKFARYCA